MKDTCAIAGSIVRWLMANTRRSRRQRDGETYSRDGVDTAFRDGADRCLSDVQRIKSEGNTRPRRSCRDLRCCTSIRAARRGRGPRRSGSNCIYSGFVDAKSRWSPGDRRHHDVKIRTARSEDECWKLPAQTAASSARHRCIRPAPPRDVGSGLAREGALRPPRPPGDEVDIAMTLRLVGPAGSSSLRSAWPRNACAAHVHPGTVSTTSRSADPRRCGSARRNGSRPRPRTPPRRLEAATRLARTRCDPAVDVNAQASDMLVVSIRDQAQSHDGIISSLVRRRHRSLRHSSPVSIAEPRRAVGSSTKQRHCSPGDDIGGLELRARPMLGCVGMAPARKEAVATSTPGPFGGTWTPTPA